MGRDDLSLPEPSQASVQALARAESLAAAGRLESAAATATPLLGEPALHARVLMLLYELARCRGDAAEAARLIGRAARLAPKSPRTQGLRAMALTETGRHEDALITGRNALRLDADEPAATAAVLLASLRLGRPGAALDEAIACLSAPEGPDAPGNPAALAVAVLDAVARGRDWGVASLADEGIAGVVRQTGPRPPTIVIAAENRELAKITPDTPWCAQAGLLGFRVPPATPLPREKAITVSFVPDGQPLFGSPLRLPAAQPRRPAPCGPLRGAVRRDEGGRLVGHLFDPAAPDAPRRVVCRGDGPDASCQTVTAGEFAPDRLAAGCGDGRCGFALDWPETPGVACQRVEVRDAATDTPLAGSPVLMPQPRVGAAALAGLNAWLRRCGETPETPPPLPEACRGPLLELARRTLADLHASLEAAPAETPPQEGGNDARR